jgi:hypothetical protein
VLIARVRSRAFARVRSRSFARRASAPRRAPTSEGFRIRRFAHTMTRVVRGVRLRAALAAPDVDADVVAASDDLAARFRRRRDAARDDAARVRARARVPTDAEIRAAVDALEPRVAEDDDAIEYREAAIATTRVECACDRATAALAVDLRIDPRRVVDFVDGLRELARMGWDDDGLCAGALARCDHDVARAVEVILARDAA